MNKPDRSIVLGALLLLPTAGGAVAARRIRGLNKAIIADAQTAGLASLDLYATTLKSIADMQQAVGQATQGRWFSQIAAAQANFTREMAETYTSAARRRPSARRGRTSRARRRTRTGVGS